MCGRRASTAQAGAALRLPRPRPGRRNPAKLLIDPYARAHRRRGTLGLRSDGARRSRLGAVRAALRRRRRAVRLGRRPSRNTAGRHGRLRAARQGFHGAHPACPRSCAAPTRARPPRRARHLTRPRRDAVELLPVHHVRPRPGARRRAACATTGATSRSASSPRTPRTRRRDPVAEFSAMVGAARRGDRGHPRRRLQPHGRGRRGRPDALPPRAGQRRLLPPGRHGRYVDDTGCGNTIDADRPHGAAAGPGRAPLLARGDARRRLPLRPRGRARARRRGSTRTPRSCRPRAGPGAGASEADRRALGHRRDATRSAASRGAGASGTASTATPCATSGAGEGTLADFATGSPGRGPYGDGGRRRGRSTS